jgi:GT2 family glycosyltransferase
VPRVVNPDGSDQRAVTGLPSWLTPLAEAVERWDPDSPELRRRHALDFDAAEEADVEAAQAVCFLVRRRALSKSEPFDESFRLYYADLDVCRRLRSLGWRLRHLPDVRVFHHGARAVAKLPDALATWHRDRLTYYRKHHGRFAGQWIKACSALAFADQLVLELWRRAHGEEDQPLGPVYAPLACCLRC